MKIIVIFAILLTFIIISYFGIRLYKNNKIKSYNSKIFEIIAIENKKERIQELNNFYNDKTVPEVSKNFAILRLINEYVEEKKYNEAKNLLIKLYKESKDENTKYFAGLNLLIVENNIDKIDENEMNKFISEMENEKNPFLDLVLEQKALFLIKQNKNSDARDVLVKLLNKQNLDANLKERSSEYLLVL